MNILLYLASVQFYGQVFLRTKLYQSSLPYNQSMSEYDFKDPIFCQELAVSQRQSTDDPLANARDSIFDIPDHNLQGQPMQLMRSTYSSKNRRSETYSARISPPAHPNNSSSFKTLVTQAGSKASGSHASRADFGLIQINQRDEFQCQVCQLQPSNNCEICHGNKTLKGSDNLIKFFQYIVAFKCKTRESYEPSRLTLTIDRTSTNYGGKNRPSERMSMRASCGSVRLTAAKKANPSEVKHELDELGKVHQSFFCDQCQVTPIVGPRFHCLECESYDQCEKCHLSHPHDHMMQKIDKSVRFQHLERIISRIEKQPKLPQGKLSLRPPPSIKRQADFMMTNRSSLH